MMEGIPFKLQTGHKTNCGRTTGQGVSLRPLTAEARIRVRFSHCGICGGHSGTGTGSSASSSVLPC
jgi:hypothetical protein